MLPSWSKPGAVGHVLTSLEEIGTRFTLMVASCLALMLSFIGKCLLWAAPESSYGSDGKCLVWTKDREGITMVVAGGLS